MANIYVDVCQLSIMAHKGSRAVAGRLPACIYRWLEGLVGSDYPNMNQALIGELTRAKTHRELTESLSPRASGASLKEQLEDHNCLRGVTCEQEA